MKGIYLTQTDAALAMGKTINQFLTIKAKLKVDDSGKKKKYFINADQLTEASREKYKNQIQEYNGDEDFSVDPVLQALTDETDLGSTLLNDQLKEVRIKKVNAEIEYLNQKIETRKKELFADWSERFFKVFCDNFGKFKNSLIELHLTDDKLSILNENLDVAVKGMESSLDEILNDFLNEKEESNDEKE